MSTLALVSAMGTALQLVEAYRGLLEVTTKAGREPTLADIEATRDAAIAASAEATEAAKRAQQREEANKP